MQHRACLPADPPAYMCLPGWLADPHPNPDPALPALPALPAPLGVPRDEATAQGFWELFSARGLGPATFQEAVDANEPFAATVGVQSAYSRTAKQATIDFR